MNKIKILLTGAAGYVGSHCNKFLNKKNFETYIVDDLSTGNIESLKWGKFYQLDFSSKEVINLLKNNKIENVFHFAASADIVESLKNPFKNHHNNVIKFIKFVNNCAISGVKNFILSSSAAIFGYPKYIPIDEVHPKNPISPYGTSKYIDEQILIDYERIFNMKFAALRYFNVAGCDFESEIGELHKPEHHIIPLLLQSIIEKNKQFEIYGNDYNTNDKTAIRDYIHVVDIAEAHFKSLIYLLENKKSIDLNIGNNQGYSILELIDITEKVTKKKVNYIFSKRRNGDPDILIASNKKAKDLIDWIPKKSSIEDIISSAWKWECKKFLN